MPLLDYRWKTDKFLEYSYAVVMGVLAAGFILLLFYLLHTPKPVATVDITQIMHHFIQNETKQNMPLEIQEKNVQIFAQKLEHTLHGLALDKQIIIMPKEAVIAGAEDLTAEVESRM